MGLFSFKKKPKNEKDGKEAAALKALPSLGLPPNSPGGANPAAPRRAPADTPPPAPPPASGTHTVSASSAVIPPAEDGAPTVFELPDVKLEETGFLQTPSAGTGSLSLVVSEPDVEPAKPVAGGEYKPPKFSLDPAPPAAAPSSDPKPDGLKTQVFPARAFRVVISALHRLSFKPTGPILKAKGEAKLCNISTSGVGLVATDFIRPPAVKSTISGSLAFENGSYHVQLEVMHVTSGVIGCKFGSEKVEGLREAIKTYFELELLALGMLKVNPAHHKAEADGNAHWIHGDQCELFYVTDTANKLTRFRLTFLGNRFVWSKVGGLNLGQVIDDRVGMMRTDRIAVMEATPEIIELTLRFLQNIPQVPQEHRDQIATAISPGHASPPVAKAS